MEKSKFKIGHTFIGNSEDLLGLSKENTLTNSDYKFYTVELDILGGYILNEFLDLDITLEHLKCHNLIYRYAESTKNAEDYRIVVLHYIIGSDKIIGYHNFYGIGGYWKLFINNKSDIVVTDQQNAVIAKFRNFPLGKEFYVYLSCLIYTLTNYKIETNFEIETTFRKVIDYVKN
jgi:hypothetical protein